MTIHLGHSLPNASRDRPEQQPRKLDLGQHIWPEPLLLGLAPGGVYHATTVTGGAVRSYRTLSPLPACDCMPAGYSLWHFP